ncbi:MAG: ribonuclease E/G, partial [Mycobacterium sp.]
MIDGGPSSEVPEDPSQHEDLPDRLRVHSLARALGTTSRQVLDALTELDGRIRSAHSTVERVDAVRVRDLLASAPATAGTSVVTAEAPADGETDEPESRTMLETTTSERPEYMPLFVAPQPVERPKESN